MFRKLILASAIAATFSSGNSIAEVVSQQITTSDLIEQSTQTTKRFIVKFKSTTEDISANTKNTKFQHPGKSQLKLQRQLASGDFLIEAESYSSMEALIEDLALNGEIYSIEEDEIVTAQHVPNDPYFSGMYSVKNSEKGINAVEAWDISQGNDINVAILDTGFSDHSDTDIRTINGYDMISYSSHSIDGDGRDNDAHDEGTGIGCETRDSSWHGTHVAGIIGASMDNAIGTVGVAPQANLIHVRVLGKCSSGYRSDIIDGIYWAAGKEISGLPLNPNPAEVINMSLGGTSACGSYQTAIDYAISQGVSVVVSAGNNNSDASTQSPANCEGVITVAASDSTGDKASYSNYSPLAGAVDVTAPGSSIIAPVNSGKNEPEVATYGYKSGTSMAAPQVAGIIALMLEKAPDLTPAQIKDILKNTAIQFPAGTDCNNGSPICGSGLVNAKAAVLEALAMTETQPITLENGVSILISGTEKEETMYQFDAPSNADTVTITLSGGTGDADLYVKKDDLASKENFDCRPWLTGNNETCSLNGEGSYSILVRGYNAYDSVNLTANYNELQHPGEGIELQNNQTQWGLSGEYHEELSFWADVPSNVKGLWVQTWGGTGDADLWVKKETPPTREDNDCLASTAGNSETCTLTPESGRYFIKVRGYDKFDNVGLRILWSF